VNRYLIGAVVAIALLAGLVVIEVTAEPGNVDVPSVVGLELRDAEGDLQSAGLGSGFRYNVRGGEGTAPATRVRTWPVVAQSPAAGAEVERGTQVELTIRMR
jgi:beta-lactam-binding protein with PASTA domain